MTYLTLEQEGIIMNMVAGVLMGLEFFVPKERIDNLNKWLTKNLEILSCALSSATKKLIFFIFILVPVFILISPIYISVAMNLSLNDIIMKVIILFLLVIVVDQIIIRNKNMIIPYRSKHFVKIPEKSERVAPTETKINNTFYNIYDKFAPIIHKYRLFKIVSSSIPKYNLSIHSDYSITTIILMLFFIYTYLYDFALRMGYTNLIQGSKAIALSILGSIIILISGFFIIRILNISPKGVIGSIGIIFFIFGNALKLWATF